MSKTILTKPLIVHLLNHTFLHLSLIVKRQHNSIELAIRPDVVAPTENGIPAVLLQSSDFTQKFNFSFNSFFVWRGQKMSCKRVCPCGLFDWQHAFL